MFSKKSPWFLSLLFAVILSVGGCSTDSNTPAASDDDDAATPSASDDDADEEETSLGLSAGFITQILPPNYKIDLPDSLVAGGGEGELEGGRVDVRSQQSSFSINQSSMGYMQLQDAISHVTSSQSEMDKYFLYIDRAFLAILEYCADTSPCNIPDGEIEITLTEEIVVSLIAERMRYAASYGYSVDGATATSVARADGTETADWDAVEGLEISDSSLDAEINSLRDLVGTTYAFPAITYTTLGGTGGYDRKVEFVDADEVMEDYGKYDTGTGEAYTFTRTIALSWDDARTKVSISNAFSDNYGSGFDSFAYDDTQKLQTINSNYTWGQDTFDYRLTLQEDAESETNGVLVSATLAQEGPNLNWGERINGTADDFGGYLETSYTWGTLDISVAGLTLPEGETWVDYIILPDTIECADGGWENAVGSVYAYEGYEGTESYAYFWGVSVGENTNPVPNINICDYSYDETTWEMIMGDEAAGIVLSTGEMETYTWYYREAFDAEGQLLAAAYRDNAEAEWVEFEMYGSFEETEYSDASAELYTIETITITITGIGDGSEYTDVQVVLDGQIPTGSNWDIVIGSAYYDTYVGSWNYYYWGVEADIAAADVYSVHWGECGADGLCTTTYELLEDASVTQQ